MLPVGCSRDLRTTTTTPQVLWVLCFQNLTKSLGPCKMQTCKMISPYFLIRVVPVTRTLKKSGCGKQPNVFLSLVMANQPLQLLLKRRGEGEREKGQGGFLVCFTINQKMLLAFWFACLQVWKKGERAEGISCPWNVHLAYLSGPLPSCLTLFFLIDANYHVLQLAEAFIGYDTSHHLPPKRFNWRRWGLNIGLFIC